MSRRKAEIEAEIAAWTGKDGSPPAEQLGKTEAKHLQSRAILRSVHLRKRRQARLTENLAAKLDGEPLPHGDKEAKPRRKKPPRPEVNWWACSRVSTGGYWRKKIKGKMHYFRFPNTPEGYRAACRELKKVIASTR